MSAFESERQFVNAVDKNLFATSTSNKKGRSSLHVSKWGSVCWPPVSRSNSLQWDNHLVDTYPSRIFEERSARQRMLHSDIWCLLTDGQVDNNEVERLQKVAQSHEALAIPVVLLVTGRKPLSEASLSVGIALLAHASDAVFLYKRIGSSQSSTCI